MLYNNVLYCTTLYCAVLCTLQGYRRVCGSILVVKLNFQLYDKEVENCEEEMSR